MTKYHAIKTMKRRSLIARNRANKRWAQDRKMREALAAIDPVRLGDVVRRVVVIDHETAAREIVFYSHDRYIDLKRKLRAIRQLSHEPAPDRTAVS